MAESFELEPAGRERRRDRAAGRRLDGPVLHVLPRDANRGAQHHARMLRDLLTRPEQPHILLTLLGSANEYAAADLLMGSREGEHLRTTLALWQTLRRLRPRSTVAHGSESLRYLALLPSSLRGRLIYHRIGVGMPQLERPTRRAFHRFMIGQTQDVVAISTAVAAEVRQLAPRRATRITVIPNGRDPSCYHPRSTPDRGRAMAIYVGALTEEKRPLWFVETCRRVPDLEGVVVGDGPLRSQVENAAAGSNVRVLGARRDVAVLLSNADLFCFPSSRFQEGMPGVLIEAALSGLPTVTTDVAGAGDVVLDGTTGFVVPWQREDLFADAVRQLAVDPVRRRRMGQAARAHAEANFSMDVCARRWCALLA